MNPRSRILSVITLVAIAAGCDSQRPVDDPAVDDPLGPEPEALGILQVIVAVNGTQPDPDGYVVVVTLASQAAPVSGARRLLKDPGRETFSAIKGRSPARFRR